jgi:hypothetical protein
VPSSDIAEWKPARFTRNWYNSKWSACDHTSPHWCNLDQFGNLIAAHLSRERTTQGRKQTLRDLIMTFAGLTGPQKAREVLNLAGLSGAYLADLQSGDDLDLEKIAALLSAMKQEARPIDAKALGRIGEALATRAMQELYGFTDDQIDYRACRDKVDGRPYTVEVVFGVSKKASRECKVLVGINWSPAIRQPFFWLLGTLRELMIDDYDPVVLVVHLVTPLVNFTDRGKSQAELPAEIREAIRTTVRLACQRWTQIKRQLRRDERAEEREIEQARKQKKRTKSIKEAAFEKMAESYQRAQSGLPGCYARARQIMYPNRELMLPLTGGKCSPSQRHGSYVRNVGVHGSRAVQRQADQGEPGRRMAHDRKPRAVVSCQLSE